MSGLCTPYSEAKWSVVFICLALGGSLMGALAIKGYPISFYPSMGSAASLYSVALMIGLAATASSSGEAGDIANSGYRHQAFAALVSTATLTHDMLIHAQPTIDRAVRGGHMVVLAATGGPLLARSAVSGTAVDVVMASVALFALAAAIALTAIFWPGGRRGNRLTVGVGRWVPESALALGGVMAVIGGSVAAAAAGECSSDSSDLRVWMIVYTFCAAYALTSAQAAMVLVSGHTSRHTLVLSVPNWTSLAHLRFRAADAVTTDDTRSLTPALTPGPDTSPDVSRRPHAHHKPHSRRRQTFPIAFPELFKALFPATFPAALALPAGSPASRK